MKRTIIAASIALASSTAMAGSIHSHEVKVPYWGDQQRANEHFQGAINDDRKVDDHQYDYLNGLKRNQKEIRADVDNNTAWNDRQEGVIRQNRGRLDENDAMNQRQNDSIDNAHARIGGVQEDLDRNWSRTENAHARIDRETYKRNELQSESRAGDQRLGAEIATVDTNSRERDEALSQLAQANMSWSIEQFNRQGQAIIGAQAGVESNRQAIASERAERKEMGKNLEAGVASAMAAAAVQFDPSYDGFQMSIAGGGYRGASAAHLAVGAKVSDSVFLSGGASHDSRGNQAYNASANFRF